MESINFIPILNLSISAFTGIVVTVYLWKKNTTITKKEKLIKIYFDLASSLENYGTHYKNVLSNEIEKSILDYIKNIPVQNGEYEKIELYEKLVTSLKEYFKTKDKLEKPSLYNPNYYLRLFTVNLSKTEYKKLSKAIKSVKENVKEYYKINGYHTDYSDLVETIDDNIIREKIDNYLLGLISPSELKLKIVDDFSRAYYSLFEKYNPKNLQDEIDEEVIDFIMRM